MLANFPALKARDVADALIESVIPALAEAIDNAACDLAADLFGDELTAFDVERLSNDLLFALSDLLVLAPVPGRGVHDMLRIHQLQNVAYAADYFGVSLHDIDQREDDNLLLNSTKGETDTLRQNSDEASPAPYSPASVTPLAEPALVVDNRPAPPKTRTLEEIKREVDSRRPTIRFTPVNPFAEQRKVAIERAALAAQREEDQRIEEGLKRESQLDAKDERDLKPLGQLPLKESKPDTTLPKLRQRTCANERCRKKFMPKHSLHKYCSDNCKTTTWRRQFGRRKAK